jgi:formate--tetrahydrofolate ligase
MKSDIEIARTIELRPIQEVARAFGITRDDLVLPVGNYKAKLSLRLLEEVADRPVGRLVLVTAITPTSLGEGKTTVSIGLSMALNRLGHKSTVCLRQPSLGPVFGIKGGAAGGGFSQVLPMEDINLHFTGDIHAVTSAHNLLAAMLDNHVHFGNRLNVAENEIVFRRCVDMNDRSLRSIVVGLGGRANGPVREDGFIITAASEVMAILALAGSLNELKSRFCRMIVAFTADGKPVRVGDLGVCGAMTALLKDAIKPNLVQTIEHTPALIHAGPFANIAHGTSSVVADRLALRLSDYVVTEAGFGSDLGAEKFVNIVARQAGFNVDAAVIVATVRALKRHGGAPDRNPAAGTIDHLRTGLANLGKHIENVRKLGLEPVVALNAFAADADAAIQMVRAFCELQTVRFAVCRGHEYGSAGMLELAEHVVAVADSGRSQVKPLYELADPVEKKIERVATEIYGAARVVFTPRAEKDLARVKDLGLTDLPVCIAKTQSSLSDDPGLVGVPRDFRVAIQAIGIAAGAGYLVPVAGDIMLMPGLAREPGAFRIGLDEQGRVIGLA